MSGTKAYDKHEENEEEDDDCSGDPNDGVKPEAEQLGLGREGPIGLIGGHLRRGFGSSVRESLEKIKTMVRERERWFESLRCKRD